MKASDFFAVDYVDQASYDNLRKISSSIDGLKNSNRKVIHTVLDKNIKELLKVQQLSAKASEYTDYLHGSLDSVIVTLGQDYCGTNQIPLLTKKGNFGTRAIPEPSAARYIFAKGSPILQYLFLKNDRPILTHQSFEGTPIEPRYFVPTLPVIFINGNRGVSSGFSQLIMPRALVDIIEILTFRLSGKIKNFEIFDKFPIYIDKYKGYIRRDVESSGYRWILEGSFEILNNKEVKIKELPYGANFMQYLQFLDELKESKKIKDFKDECDGDNFCFKIIFKPEDLKKHDDESLIKLLKLRTFVTENFTSLGADNKIKEFAKPSEILEHYFRTKMDSLDKRKNLIIDDLKSQIDKKTNQRRFIKEVLDGSINLKALNTKEVNAYLETHKYSKYDGYTYLTNMPVSSMQMDKMDILNKEIEKLSKDKGKLESTSLEDIWLKDIQDFVKAYKDLK